MVESTTVAAYACHDCREPFPRTAAYFYPNTRISDGLATACKACARGRVAASRAQVPPGNRPLRFRAQTYAAFLVWWRAHPRRGSDAWIDGLLQIQAHNAGGYRLVIVRDGQPVAGEADGAA